MVNQTERINAVLNILYRLCFCEKRLPPGVVGADAEEAVGNLRETIRLNQIIHKEADELILLFRDNGFNDALVADGVLGAEFNKALDAFLALGGNAGAGTPNLPPAA